MTSNKAANSSASAAAEAAKKKDATVPADKQKQPAGKPKDDKKNLEDELVSTRKIT